MPTVDLPALDGRTPLGFLAALGLQRVLAHERGIPARLGYSDTAATALLDSPLRTTAEIAGELHAYVATAADGAAIAGISPDFPLRAGRGKDPMRCPRNEFTALYDTIAKIDPKAADVWLPSLLTDLAVDDQGRAALTPYLAPAGKQNIRTFFATPLNAVREHPEHLHHALTQWWRIRDFTGEYLDHQALRTKTDDANGDAGKGDGVPGATWLATMALPQLHITGDGTRATATLWHHTPQRHMMIWPLWRHPLTINAVHTLLNHPAIAPLDTTPAPMLSSRTWPELNVFTAYAAERQPIPGRKFAGVLSPTSLHIGSDSSTDRTTGYQEPAELGD